MLHNMKGQLNIGFRLLCLRLHRPDCSLLGAIAMHYVHLGLGLGLGLGLALVFSETNCTVTVYFNGAQ